MTMQALPVALSSVLSEVCGKYVDGHGKNTQVVQYKDMILDACLQHGYASVRRMGPKTMGCHPRNRDGGGIHVKRAHSRIQKIVKAGCSASALKENLVGIEDHPINKHIETFTVAQTALSPEYAQYRAGDIKGGTLGCSHCTHGMAQLHDERPCVLEGISEEGKMSQNLCFSDKLLKQFTMEGMDWLMIRWEVEVAFPLVPTIVQAALNTTQQIAEGESWPQLLCKIAQACEVQKNKDGDVDIKKVQLQVIKSQPPRAHDVPDMVEFVRVWGGLPSAFHVNEMSKMSQTFPSDRVVSGSFFKWLAQLRESFSVQAMPSFFVNAVLYVHASSMDGVQDDIARYITKQEVAMLGNKLKRATVMEADKLLSRGQKIVDMLPSQQKLQLLATLKHEVVMCVLARKGHNEIDKRTLAQIAADFAKRASGIDDRDQPQPSGAQTAHAARNVVTYNADGEVVGCKSTLSNKGFNEGDFVTKVRDAAGTVINDKCKQWRIKSANEDGTMTLLSVSIEGKVTEEESTVTIEEFIACYREVHRIEVVGHFPMSAPENNTEMQQLAIKGQVSSCILAMTREHPSPDVILMNAPEKKVIAKDAYPALSLRIAPSTSSVHIETDAKKTVNPKSVECDIEGYDGRIMLNSMPNTKDFTCVFWNMKVVGKRDDANMELEAISYNFKIPCASSAKLNKNPWMSFTAYRAVNFKEISAMSELVLYRENQSKGADPSEKAKRKVCAVIEASKKQKASE